MTAEVLQTFWQELDAAFGIELAESKCGVQDFLKQRNPALLVVRRQPLSVAAEVCRLFHSVIIPDDLIRTIAP